MVKRTECVICEGKLINQFTVKMPIFMGVNRDDRNNIIQDMNFMKCCECGEIQIEELIDLSELYYDNHNIGIIGSIWENHYNEFSKFISEKIINKTILEISDPSAKIAKKSQKFNHWYIVEPNPDVTESDNITFVKGFFDNTFDDIKNVDIIIHSHLLEHIHKPNDFLKKCYELLNDEGSMFVSIPNMEFLLMNEYSPNNILHFEHTFYLDTEVLSFLLSKNGFKIINEVPFKNHSIFYEIKKDDKENVKFETTITNRFTENLSKNLNKLQKINEDIDELLKNNNYNVHIFGSHVMTQFYLYNGLKTSINYVLDNSPYKIGYKLYGTDLMVSSPEIIKEGEHIVICSHTGVYYEEIVNQLKSINNSVIFL